MRFPQLFLPDEDLGDSLSWLEHWRGMYDAIDMIRGAADAAAVGIVRDHSTSDKVYIFHGVEQVAQDCSEQQFIADVCLKVKSFPKRTNFLHQVSADVMEKKDDFVFLDPKDCRTNRLPVIYFQFAMFIPSIMHHVENADLTDHLCNGLLVLINFFNSTVVLLALCTLAVREEEDYQRLELLDDSILKMLTFTALMADHSI